MIKNILFGLLLVGSVYATDNKFFNAIHQVESGGKVGAIVGDNGKALGPLQIHRVYFLDASQYDKSLGTNYNCVTNLAFSKRVVTAYMNRYCPTAVKNRNYQTMARIHNGGPSGHKKSATVGYWRRVEAKLK